MNFKPRWYWFPLYVWASVNTAIGMILAVVCNPVDSQWKDGVWIVEVDSIVGGEWIAGQTWGWLVLVKSGSMRTSLRVHEFVHVWHGLQLGVFFLIGYGGHYVFNRIKGMAHQEAYRAIWSERIAYRIQREYEEGKLRNTWGA